MARGVKRKSRLRRSRRAIKRRRYNGRTAAKAVTVRQKRRRYKVRLYRFGAYFSKINNYGAAGRYTLKYAMQKTLVPADVPVLNTSKWVVRMNSIFDPDFATGGQQPYGRDQLALQWDNYRVISIRIKVTAYNAEVTASAGKLFPFWYIDAPSGQHPEVVTHPAVSTAVGWALIHESPAYHRLRAQATGFNHPRNEVRFNKLFPVAAMLKRKGELGDLSMSGFGANPSSEMFFTMALASDVQSTTFSMQFNVELFYNIECTGPKNLGRS